VILVQQVAECPTGDTWMDVVFICTLLVCITVAVVAYFFRRHP